MKTLPVIPEVMALKAFTAQMGVTTITAWRWRKKGWLETVNIAGRPYVTREGITRFKERATAGAFAQEHKTPKRVGA